MRKELSFTTKRKDNTQYDKQNFKNPLHNGTHPVVQKYTNVTCLKQKGRFKNNGE